MDEVKEIPISNIPTNLYKGPEGGKYTCRGIDLINRTYYFFCKESEEMQDFFDSVLRKQLDRVKISGDNKLVLLDIGSGEGVMLAELLDNPDLLKQSRQFLRENPDFKIIAVGFTDSTDESNQGKEKPIIRSKSDSLSEEDLSVNQQIEIKNYFWSLSGRQNLSMFCDHIGLNKVDLVYATEVFQYLSPNVFNEVIDTVSKKLNSGGQLFCSRFSGVPPGFVPYTTKFTESHVSPGEDSWKELIKKCSDDMTNKSFLNTLKYADLQTDLEKAKDFYIRIGVLNKKMIEEAELEAVKYLEGSETEKEILQEKVYKILNKAASRLKYLREKKDHEMKIDLLKRKRGVSVDFLRNTMSFVLTKE